MTPSVTDVLIVDEELTFARNVQAYLRLRGFNVAARTTCAEALEAVSLATPRLVIVDHALPDADGLDVLASIHRIAPEVRVILLTGMANASIKARALAVGAIACLDKPITLAHLGDCISKALGGAPHPANRPAHGNRPNDLVSSNSDGNPARDLSENSAHQGALPLLSNPGPSMFQGSSPAAGRLREILARLIDADTPPSEARPVLILGKEGSGKRLVADILHACGSRRCGPFIKMDCAGTPLPLQHEELFGKMHELCQGLRPPQPGCVTVANGGTLYLENVEALGPECQAGLLRLLEGRWVIPAASGEARIADVRIAATSRQSLNWLVGHPRFRADLLHRLGGIRIRVPSLRERGEDLEDLAAQFLREVGHGSKATGQTFSKSARQAMRMHDWPGNIRELRARVQQAALLASGCEIQPADLGLESDTVLRVAAVQP